MCYIFIPKLLWMRLIIGWALYSKKMCSLFICIGAAQFKTLKLTLKGTISNWCLSFVKFQGTSPPPFFFQPLVRPPSRNPPTQCLDLKLQSICMQLWITLTCRPHLSAHLKPTFIQMRSPRWRLTLNNPSKCSIWRNGLALFESSEAASLTVRWQIFEREAVERFPFFFRPGKGVGGVSSNVFKSLPTDELYVVFFPTLLQTSLVFPVFLKPIKCIEDRP